MGAPPPLFTRQPSATPLLLVNQPKTRVWTMTPHQCWIQPHDPAWQSRRASHSPTKRWQRLAQLTQLSSNPPSTCCSLQTWLNGSVPAPAPPSPPKHWAFLFPVNSARPVSSLQLLAKAPPRARRFCTVAVATLWVCSSWLGKAGVCLQISFLQMQGQ